MLEYSRYIVARYIKGCRSLRILVVHPLFPTTLPNHCRVNDRFDMFRAMANKPFLRTASICFHVSLSSHSPALSIWKGGEHRMVSLGIKRDQPVDEVHCGEVGHHLRYFASWSLMGNRSYNQDKQSQGLPKSCQGTLQHKYDMSPRVCW